MKEKMASAKENADVLSHLLRCKYKKNAKIIYAIVEGEDDIIYYSHFIEEYLKKGWDYEFIKAPTLPNKMSKKKQIIRFFNGIDWRTYNKKQVIILIDKDLSLFIDEKIPKSINVYTTDGYSIENSIINERTFCRTICELCNFTDISLEQKNAIKDIYNSEIEFFYDHIKQIMITLIYWMSKNKKVQSNNIKVKDLFAVKKAKTTLKKEDFLEYLEKKCQLKIDNMSELQDIEKKFIANENYKNFVRGKYLWEFYILLCNSVVQDYENIPNLRLKKRCRTAPKLDFIDIAHISKIPSSLKDFLDCTIKKYIYEI